MNKQYLLLVVLAVLLILPLALPYVFQADFWAESTILWTAYILVATVLAVYLFYRFLQARLVIGASRQAAEESLRLDGNGTRVAAIVVFGAMIMIFILLSGFSFLGGRERPDPQAFAFQGHDAIEGKRVFQAYNCMGCHTILGNGAYFAPDLTEIYRNGGAAWAVTFLSSPGTWPTKQILDLRITQLIQSGDLKEAASPEEYYQKYPHVAEAVTLFGGKRTVMPNLAFKAEEISALVAFMKYTAEINTAGWPPARKADVSVIERFQARFGVVAPSTEPAASVGGAAQPTESSAPPVVQGDQLAQSLGCLACHSTDGTKIVGPTWKGLYGSTVTLTDGNTVAADEAYLQESILDPNAKLVQGFSSGVMPSYSGQVTPDETQALIVYISDLK